MRAIDSEDVCTHTLGFEVPASRAHVGGDRQEINKQVGLIELYLVPRGHAHTHKQSVSTGMLILPKGSQN